MTEKPGHRDKPLIRKVELEFTNEQYDHLMIVLEKMFTYLEEKKDIPYALITEIITINQHQKEVNKERGVLVSQRMNEAYKLLQKHQKNFEFEFLDKKDNSVVFSVKHFLDLLRNKLIHLSDTEYLKTESSKKNLIYFCTQVLLDYLYALPSTVTITDYSRHICIAAVLVQYHLLFTKQQFDNQTERYQDKKYTEYLQSSVENFYTQAEKIFKPSSEIAFIKKRMLHGKLPNSKTSSNK